MEQCDRCGNELTRRGNSFLRCASCAVEHDDSAIVLACADELSREACDWCAEELCVYCTRLGSVVADVA